MGGLGPQYRWHCSSVCRALPYGVAVPDPRLQQLADLYAGAPVVPATVTFVDIAGLVRGASQGEGLGNQFLAAIRETEQRSWT